MAKRGRPRKVKPKTEEIPKKEEAQMPESRPVVVQSTPSPDEPQAGNGATLSRLYWSPASKQQIANRQPEIKQGGQLIQPEKPLRFSDNTYLAKTQEDIDFIENSDDFQNNIIKVAPNMQTARAWTMQQDRRKAQVQTIASADSSIQEVSGEVNESTSKQDEELIRRAMGR